MNESTDPFLPGFQTLDLFSSGLFEKLVKVVKLSNSLPQDEEYKYFTSFRPFKSKMDSLGQRVLDASQAFLQQEKGDKAPAINSLEDDEEVVGQFDLVVDVVDSLIEQVDSYIDEAKGITNKPNIVIRNKNPVPKTSVQNSSFDRSIRPQSKWPPVDNSNTPWRPVITEKPNALQPLHLVFERDNQPRQVLSPEMESHMANLGMKLDDLSESYPHPYELEISQFTPPPAQLLKVKERLYLPLDQTPFTYVSTPDQLERLARLLNHETEIAIDLEHHSFRSFQGFVCLMQISTRKEDFLVDTLELRTKMHILNSSFTNPNIVKVLHGSDSDIVWLQRDFGLYIVNLFDTGQASRVLEYPKFSLAYLLSFYCNIDADKKYQLADWRVRPLPAEMIKYAREDTHYLLYIYDRMKNALIERGNEQNNLLLAVINRSKELSLKRYEKEKLTPTSHLILYNKYNLVFNPQQMRVFAALFAWRDELARKEDESPRYVLPNHVLFRLAEQLPTDEISLMKCCHPITPLIRTHSAALVRVIVSSAYATPTDSTNNNIGSAQLIAPGLIVPSTPNAPRVMGNSTINDSPVLGAEQLFDTAKWIDSEDVETPYIPKGGSTVCSEGNKNFKVSEGFQKSLFSDTFSEEEDEDLAQSKKTASLVHASLASENLMKPSFFIQDSKSEKDETVPVTNEKPSKESIPDNVPQSMAEIYELSNQIKRKRSQKKKAIKEETVKPQDDESSDDENNNKRQKGTEKNAADFMKDIGWMESEEVPAEPLISHEQPTGNRKNDSNKQSSSSEHNNNNNKFNHNNNKNKQTGKQQGGNAPFTPFDYSNAGKHSQAGDQQQQHHNNNNNNSNKPFNPFQKPHDNRKGGRSNNNNNNNNNTNKPGIKGNWRSQQRQ